MADTARITAAIISTNQAEDLHNDLDLHLQNNSLPPALPLPSCLPDTSFLLVLHLTCSTVSCLHELFLLINTAPGVRSNHLIGAPPYLAVNNQLCLCPYYSPRHWQPCPSFRPLSTYTRPPYPGATPSPPSSFNHLRAFSLPAPIRASLYLLTTCAHPRCLRPYTSPNKLR